MALLGLGGGIAVAQSTTTPGQPGWFPFTISTQDASPSPIDLSALNEKPAGASGILKVDGEWLVDGKGRKVRLFGTNFCGTACFPPEELAPQIAAHLAKNGVNVVRLHHMDNDWGKGSSIIGDNEATTLNEQNLARMDKLAAELIAHGIYLNINLHVSRTYPGTPKGAPSYSKGLDHYHRPFIAQFQAFAKTLLNHVNPHTGRAYKDEPGVAVIEMNNENSILLNPWWTASLPEPFKGELQGMFLKYLKGQYKDTAALQTAWGVNDGSTGPELIKNGSFTDGAKEWFVEATNGAQATAKAAGDGAVRWTSTAIGSVPWSLQFYQVGLNLDEKASYRVTFKARSQDKSTISVIAMNSAAPWAQLGLSENVTLTPEWEEYHLDFAPHSVLPDGKNRVGFGLLNKITTVELKDIRLHTVPNGFLKPDQTLEAGTIPIPERSANVAVRRDFIAFLADLEIEHALEMKKFIREEIGAKQMITHSQLLFGGIAGARREFAVSDLVDTHGYWHHPSFPRKSWDMNDWYVNNVSQVVEKSGGTLAEIAMQRPVGKPYSLSEYDVPAPNDYAAETFPLLSAMASVQDWSAVYHFAFKHNTPYDSDRITSFFDLPGHPAKQAMMPIAALVYRKGLITPFSRGSTLKLGKGPILDYAGEKAGDVWGSWRPVWDKVGKSGAIAWTERVGMQLSEDNAWELTPFVGMLRKGGDTVKVNWVAEGKNAELSVVDRKAVVFSGTLGSGKQELGAISVALENDSPASNVTLMAAALDDKSLADSKRIWLAVVSRAENVGMGWDANRTTVGTKWGKGPAEVLGVKAVVGLPDGGKWKVQALDAKGNPQQEVPTEGGSFKLSPDQKTVWWLLTRQ